MLSTPNRSLLPSGARIACTCAGIFVLSHLIFLIGIDQPKTPYFDEVHYVPAARQLLHGIGSQPVLISEHPPLAKELMAIGMAIFGDTPIGWRYVSALFGSFALVGLYLWALALFDDEHAARWATIVTLANQILYVQARIAMLDIFLVAFIVWAMAAFTATWRSTARTKRLFAATGVFLGLATACKLSGVVPWALCLAIVTVVKWLQWRNTRFNAARQTDWYRPDLWASMRLRDWVLCLGVVPFFVDLLTFIPTHGFSLTAFVRAHVAMWRAQMSVVPQHPYMSSWTGWPFLRRPVWYLFDRMTDDSIQAVVFLGNPVVFWGGIFAVLICVYAWIASRRADAFLIVATYGALYLSWAVSPRSLALSYYYLPAAMVVSLALAFMFYKTPLSQWVWARRSFATVAVLTFLYFFPISSAAVTVTMRTFQRLMWFRSWI